MRQASSAKVEKKTSSLSKAVYGKLLERIMNGVWTPGTIYDRRSVASELGVSIAPVGEAMIRLEEDGFIVNLPRKGTMLRTCDPRRLYESLIMREAVECQAIRMSFGKLRQHEAKLRKLAIAASGERGKEQRDADAAFHKELVGLCGVKSLSEQLERLTMQVLFDELHLLDSPEKTFDSHISLLDELIAANSPEAASERMRRHLRIGREGLFKRFEN